MLSYASDMATPPNDSMAISATVAAFYDRVEELGRQHGLDSLRAISLESGLSHSSLWKAKSRGNLPKLSSMRKVAARLNTTTDQLLQGGTELGADDVEALAVSLRALVAHAATTHRKNPALGEVEHFPPDDVPSLYYDYARLVLTTIDKAREGWTQAQILPLLEGALHYGLPSTQELVQSQKRGDPEGSSLPPHVE